MPGVKSTIALHPRRAEIEAQLRQGVPAAHVARDFNLSRQAVSRHKGKLVAKPAAVEDGDREAMLRQVKSLYSAVVGLVKEAQEAKHPRKFLTAVGEARRCLNLLSKILGLLNEVPAPTVAVNVEVDIVALREVIVTALGPYPEAAASVAAALVEYDAGGGAPPA